MESLPHWYLLAVKESVVTSALSFVLLYLATVEGGTLSALPEYVTQLLLCTVLLGFSAWSTMILRIQKTMIQSAISLHDILECYGKGPSDLALDR